MATQSPLAVGERAPEFALHATPDQQVALSAFFGRPIVLVFYPADWSPVCGDQLALYNELQDEWRRYRAQLLAISVDSPWSHVAFATERHLHIPLLSDFEPKGDVAKRYRVYDSVTGVAERALFVIAPDATIAWTYVSPAGVNPGADGILDALESVTKGHARA